MFQQLYLADGCTSAITSAALIFLAWESIQLFFSFSFTCGFSRQVKLDPSVLRPFQSMMSWNSSFFSLYQTVLQPLITTIIWQRF